MGMDEDLPASDLGPSFAKLASFTGPCASTNSGAGPEVEVRALASMASALYPLARAEGLRGLAAVLEKGNAGSGVAECCYRCAVELLRDEDEGIRLAAVRLVGLCGEKFTMREELGGDADQMDLVFLQLSSMARDMCAKVRTEAFDALAKTQRVSDRVLLQSLSKKIIKTDTGSAPGKKLPPKLIFPCAAGIFAHGIEDEFYQVRTAACKTLGVLARFSNQYAEKALDLLMDMMNDDTEAVRLQTLETLLDMATYGHLSVQEKHMHMFLGILMDSNVIVRNAARKILGSVKLPKLQMFKSALDGLIAGLEKNPEDQDIYGVLFSIGNNHGSFSANIAKHLAKEISMASDGELILDKPRIKALLIVSILAPSSVDKEKELDIPAVILSHGIPLLGRISCALGEDKQDSLLCSLFHRSGMPFWEKRLVSSEGGNSEGFSVEAMGGTHAQIEKTGMKTSYLDEVMIMQSTRLILETVQGAWALRKSCSIGEVRITLSILEIFDLKPATDFGMINATSAVLKVCDTDSGNPLSYVGGLPVGISFDISLFNISSHDRIWLRMVAGESTQHVCLDLSCFGGDDKVKSRSTVIPFYATPMACSFVLRVCLVIECPFGSTGDHQEGHGGPRDCVVQLCDELAVYFVSADTEQRRRLE